MLIGLIIQITFRLDRVKAWQPKGIQRKLLFHLVDIVWGEAHEDKSVPSTDWSRRMIQKAIERTRREKYERKVIKP